MCLVVELELMANRAKGGKKCKKGIIKKEGVRVKKKRSGRINQRGWGEGGLALRKNGMEIESRVLSWRSE